MRVTLGFYKSKSKDSKGSEEGISKCRFPTLGQKNY